MTSAGAGPRPALRAAPRVAALALCGLAWAPGCTPTGDGPAPAAGELLPITCSHSSLDEVGTVCGTLDCPHELDFSTSVGE